MKVVMPSASRTGRLYPHEMFLVLIFTRGWVNPQGLGTVGRNMSLKNPVTPPGIDPGNIQLVAQRLNHYATPGPCTHVVSVIYRGRWWTKLKCEHYRDICIVCTSYIVFTNILWGSEALGGQYQAGFYKQCREGNIDVYCTACHMWHGLSEEMMQVVR